MAKHKLKRHHDKKQVHAEEPVQSGLRDRIRSGRFRFALAFAFSCIGFYALINALPGSFTKPLNEHTARTLGLLLNAFGIPALTAGDIVSEKGLAFKIIPECTPIFTAGLFFSFVAFQPASMRQKATGLAWGIPALYLGNLARLAATFMISRYNRLLFDVSHVYLGQVLTLFLVISCCILWMRWVAREEAGQDTAMDIVSFPARFGLISAGLFLVWIKVHHGYIRFLDWLMALGFSLFGRSAGLAHETAVYYETFGIVIIVSLVLAARSIPWRRRVPILAAGLGMLFFIHLFHRIDNALLVLYNVTAMRHADLTTLVIGQYLVPVLLFLHVIGLQRKYVPGKTNIRKIQ